MHRSKLDQPPGNAPGRAPAADTGKMNTTCVMLEKHKVGSLLPSAKTAQNKLFDKRSAQNNNHSTVLATVIEINTCVSEASHQAKLPD